MSRLFPQNFSVTGVKKIVIPRALLYRGSLCWEFFLELNSKRLYASAGKEKKVVALCSRPLQNVKIGISTSKSYGDGKEMYKKA